MKTNYFPLFMTPGRYKRKDEEGAGFLEAQNFLCLGTLIKNDQNKSTVPVMS